MIEGEIVAQIGSEGLILIENSPETSDQGKKGQYYSMIEGEIVAQIGSEGLILIENSPETSDQGKKGQYYSMEVIMK